MEITTPPKEPTASFTVRLPVSMLKRLQELADSHKTKRTAVLVDLLRQSLRQVKR